ncbi:DUF4440 domain-containing protein [Aliiroseovarius sp. YM-037]|uniref:DUF4440 domain-containing protein n=1 Tax=Aliiroseovarius sp. YM-037 TaxID=3341728 RepID=UPI003A805269
MDEEILWDNEQSFWLDGPDFFRANMTKDARMVFPDPVGILKGDEILQGLEGAPRWASVSFDEKSLSQTATTAVLTYKATGERDGDDPYAALCCSTYVKASGDWKLLAHQQTPV